jgi:hypothetical protein
LVAVDCLDRGVDHTPDGSPDIRAGAVALDKWEDGMGRNL